MRRADRPRGVAPGHRRRGGRRRTASLAAAAVVAVLGGATWLAGAVPDGVADAAQPGYSCAGPAAPAPAPPPSAAEGADGLESAPLTFGRRFSWPSGVSVQVAPPIPFTPSRSATGVTGNRILLVRTTVCNGGPQPYHLNVFSFGPEATYGGVEATKVVDRARGTGNLGDVVVAPGQSFAYATALSVGAGPGQLELDYTEELGDDDPAVFVGTVRP